MAERAQRLQGVDMRRIFMSVIAVNPRFNPGRVMITRNAKDVLPYSEVNEAINRHLRGDWGDVCGPPEPVQSDQQRRRRRGSPKRQNNKASE